jgi:DNA-binding GntR family transcriptional regulator
VRFEALQASSGASVADAVYRTLRLAIVTMALPPGTRLTEQEIGDGLRISRQPVREALLRLRDIELVVIKPQRGSFVAPIDPDAVRSAQFVREAVETAIVRQAASVCTVGSRELIEEVVSAQGVAVRRGDAGGFFRLDEQFHRTLAMVAGCGPAWRTIEGVKGHMDRVRYLSLPNATPLERLLAQHRDIAESVLSGDAEAAAGAMRTHLREIVTSLPVLAERHPDLFSSPASPPEAHDGGVDPRQPGGDPVFERI